MADRNRTFLLEGHIKTVSPLATCSKDMKDRSEREGNNRPLPVPRIFTEYGERLYFPGTGFRGTLRRVGRDILRQTLIDATGKKAPLSLDEHYLATLGGIKGERSQERSSVEMEASVREKNPLLSLFGAGDAGVLGFMKGHLAVLNAIAREPADSIVFAGTRTDDLYQDKSQVQFLSDSDIKMLIDRASGGRKRSTLQAQIKVLEKDIKTASRQNKESEITLLKNKIAELHRQILEIKDESGTSDVSIGMPLPGWEAIPPGLLLEQGMILARSNDTELGFLLHILNTFASFPILGAHYAVGNGIVSGEWTVSEATLKGRRLLGSISFDAFEQLTIIEASIENELTCAMEAFGEFQKSGKLDCSIPTIVSSK